MLTAERPSNTMAFWRRLRAGLKRWHEAGRLAELLAGLSTAQLHYLARFWPIWARDEQLPPESDWTVWLILGGRGAGKTRAGAEWVRAQALGQPPFLGRPVGRIALVGETFSDAREVMVEGVSGLLGVHGARERPEWTPSRRRLEWANGAVAQLFSAEDPDALRGPQFGAAWADELAKWHHAEAAWDMLQFGLRLGERPRQLVTTTPRPLNILRRLMDDPATALTRMRTQDNSGHLAQGFLEAIVGRYRGARIGRQELDAEILEDRPDALFQREAIDAARVRQAPELGRIVVAVDPPASAHAGSASCGIVAAGIAADGGLYVLADQSAAGLSPAGWAGRAVALWHRLEADRLIAEANQGGNMVAAVIGEVDASVPVSLVHARRGKWLRAEPVAALYEQGRVRHVGAFGALEDEMCDFGPDGLSGGRSPDRLDALVWAITALALGPKAEPRVRGF